MPFRAHQGQGGGHPEESFAAFCHRQQCRCAYKAELLATKALRQRRDSGALMVTMRGPMQASGPSNYGYRPEDEG